MFLNSWLDSNERISLNDIAPFIELIQDKDIQMLGAIGVTHMGEGLGFALTVDESPVGMSAGSIREVIKNFKALLISYIEQYFTHQRVLKNSSQAKDREGIWDAETEEAYSRMYKKLGKTHRPDLTNTSTKKSVEATNLEDLEDL